MPLLYDEGSRAFIMLQEVVKIYTDESLFAWSGTCLRPKVRLDMLAPDLAAFELSRNVVPLPIARSSYSITTKASGLHCPYFDKKKMEELIGVLVRT